MSDFARFAELSEEIPNHAGMMPDILAHCQQPFWHDPPEKMGDYSAVPKKSSPFNEAAGDRLRRCREFLGQTQEQFAEALHISRTVLENWESGDNCPRPEPIERARRRYGITHDWVYGGNAYLLPDDMKVAVAKPRAVEAVSKGKRARA